MLAEPFILPKGVNIITLTQVGNACSLSARIDDAIRSFYNSGNTFFKNKDKSTKLTDEGIAFERMLQDSSFEYKLKNHVGNGSITMNNQIFQFHGTGCATGVAGLCSIDCIHGTSTNAAGDETEMKQKLNCIYSNRLKNPIKEMTLNEIIYRETWPKTFIIRACRSYFGTEKPRNITLMRQISNDTKK
jgi:hypothetical protein